MAIEAKCPTCQKVYNLRDNQAGARVVCRNCNEQFTVPGGNSSESARKESPDPRPFRDKPRRKASSRSSGQGESLTWLWLTLGIGGGVILLLFCTCGGVYFLFVRTVQQAQQNIANQAAQPAVPNPMFPFEQDQDPKDLNDAVDRLNRGVGVKTAVIWLQRQNVDQNKQPVVAQSLAKVLSGADHWTKQEIFKALEKWATRDQVPLLIETAEKEHFDAQTAAVNGLIRLRDPQSFDVLLNHIDDAGNRAKTDEAFKAMATENPQMFNDRIVSSLTEGNDKARRAAEYLIRTPIDANSRATIAATLANAAGPGPFRNEQIIKALSMYAGSDEVPTLITIVQTEHFGDFANVDNTIAALVRLKDQRGINALKAIANNGGPNQGKAKDALRKMGVSGN